MIAATLPGVRFAVVPAVSPSPLRSDVAGFFGRARRGVVGRAQRVVGWREYLRLYGGLDAAATMPYALRGYFGNGGEVAHVIRIAGGAATSAVASPFDLGPLVPAASRFASRRYAVTATSPGAWANGTSVSLDYRRDGIAGAPELDVTVRAPGEPVESFVAVDPAALETLGSQLVQFALLGPVPGGPAPGPRGLSWEVTLDGGADDAPAFADYLAAVDTLDEVAEVALVVAPDLHGDLAANDDRRQVLGQALAGAAALLDRLVVVDVPPEADDARAARAWIAQLRGAPTTTPDGLRAGAAYHPGLWVADPLGGAASPLRLVPPGGHVAGVISRLDRQRGAHHTPANAPILDASDLGHLFDDADSALLDASGVNLLICRCGRGLAIWGGRTLEPTDPTGIFVAHRRLIHRLVRAIRRVAEPLVFDVNGPELRLAFTRAVTAVLLEAFRGGALVGARPEQAFRVQCDDQNNPPSEVDLGRCVCDIAVAPAVPMELITLRIALSSDGGIEVTT